MFFNPGFPVDRGEIGGDYSPDGKIIAQDRGPNEFFGCSVAMAPDKEEFVVGAYQADSSKLRADLSPLQESEVNTL